MRRFLDRSESVLTYTAVFSIFIMMCLTTVDAIGRYVFNYPLTGAYEITEKYLILAAVFLGVSYSYRGGAFIRVTILMDHLPGRVRIPINYFSQVFSIAYSAALFVASIQQILRSHTQHQTLSSLPLPTWPGSWVISAGLLLASLLLLFDLPRVRTGKSALFKDQSPIA